MGAFLLWTMTFVLADDSKDAKALSGSMAPEPTITSVDSLNTAEATTWDTAEATTWDTVEATSWATAEAATWTTAEATSWATAEAATWTTAEATSWATAEATSWATAEATSWATAEATTWTTAQSKYSEEQIKAYEWALENGITTINDIEKARLTDGLTRAELAKMMSQYMTKVMWKTPVDAEKVNYTDVNSSLWDLADFIQTAYAYKIMWINADGTPLKKFNPRGKVTRAEYATVFSRVLFGDKYNKSEWNYYENHIKALKEAGILTNDTPTIQEVRGWVMLMMYRSSNVKSETPAEEWTGEVAEIANPASEYCVAQGGTVNIVKDAEGNESGMCKLADGTEVDEWEYYRENNKEATTTEEATVAETTTWDTVEAPEAAEATTWDTAEAPEATTTESN